MHVCRLCKEELDESFFSYRGGGRRKDSLQADCVKCANKRSRDYRQITRDRVGLYKLDKGCEVCGFRATHSCQLDLDHIDPNTKTYKGSHKSFDAGWSWVRIERELTLCQVLCKNCHALRTYEENHWKNEHTTVRMR